MENIITFNNTMYWDRLNTLWLSTEESRDIVKLYTVIGGIGETDYIYCRIASKGSCAVKINGKWAFRPIYDDDDEPTVHSHELSGMFNSDCENTVELYVKGGSAVRAVFFFGGADGKLSVLASDEGWSAARTNIVLENACEIHDSRGTETEILTPTYPAFDPPNREDSPAAEPNCFVNPIKVYTDDKGLSRIYDFGAEFYGVPIITASLRRGGRVFAAGSLSMPNLTLIEPNLFRESSKILVCSGFGADRLYPIFGAIKFRYIYAYGDGADYVITAAAKI